MKDILQEQLEAEFRGGEIDFGDPLDPEEASEEDIAAELLRHGRGQSGEVKKEDFDDAGSTEDWAEVDESDLGDESLNEGEEEAEPSWQAQESEKAFPSDQKWAEQEEMAESTASEEEAKSPLSIGDWSGMDTPLEGPDSGEIEPAAVLETGVATVPTEQTRRPSRRRGRGRRGRGRGTAEGVASAEGESTLDEAVETQPAEVPEEAGRPAEPHVRFLWERLLADPTFPLSALERRADAECQAPQYIHAVGSTQEGSRAALVASPDVDGPLLVHGLRFLAEIRAAGEQVNHLVLSAPYFADETRRAAYLVDPKRVRLKLLRYSHTSGAEQGYRSVDTLRPEVREVSRPFDELVGEIAPPKLRRLITRFKEVAEGLILEMGGEKVICRGGKIYFRMRGAELLVARPRDKGLLVEVLYPRGRAFRLTEQNLDAVMQKVRESFEAARKQPGLAQRESSFRLSVRRALEEKGGDLTPLDEDIPLGSNRLRIDVLAVRPNGTPVAIHTRTRLTLEELYRGLLAFCALREQAAFLRAALGRDGAVLDTTRDPELVFAALRIPEVAASIANQLVPKVKFLKAKPERRWWETGLVLEGMFETAPQAGTSARAEEVESAQAVLAESRMAIERTPRPSLRIESKNPAVIVSHYDRDGIIANLVLARALPNLASQRFMNSEDLLTLFFTEEMQAGLPEVYDLYIADLRFRPTTRLAPDVREAFVDRLRKHPGKVYWFDHIYWQDIDRRDMEAAIGRANLVITPKERTAALTVKHALRIRDPFTDKLIDLLYGKLPAAEYDAWGKNWLSIIDYLRNDMDRIESAVRPLREGHPEEVNTALLEEGMRKEQEAEAYVADRDFRVVIFGSYKMVVVDLPDKTTFNYTGVTQKVRERYRAQLSITAFGDDETILIANSFSSRKGMNMSIMKEHLTKRFDWLKPVQGHENVITLKVAELPCKRERLDMIINEIVRNRSLFA